MHGEAVQQATAEGYCRLTEVHQQIPDHTLREAEAAPNCHKHEVACVAHRVELPTLHLPTRGWHSAARAQCGQAPVYSDELLCQTRYLNRLICALCKYHWPIARDHDVTIRCD